MHVVGASWSSQLPWVPKCLLLHIFPMLADEPVPPLLHE